ncbi:NAD(P)H-dependent flavin oxidoreductase [Nocardioides nitrophenolicus]|uniref:NAD(P)H-dependent flavin oxidoreductase n=1 Tax=Nocardioides nitrophenolicus TaxID=60489 RepID=UPI00195617C0|nr:nitronate monooxygenase [Nocardioides nitrophenolicus]MBM7516957.1 NAD(P)H-dependent flavin oxidoreductase YrpB (nitropropane dioxygenase family) [Nocardioides nitrophenolicus]
MSPLQERIGARSMVFGFSQDKEVVAALARAGGVGILGAKRRTRQQLRAELSWIRDHADGGAYGVNLVFRSGGGSLPAPLPQRHLDFVAQLQRRFDIPAGSTEGSPHLDPTRGSIPELVEESVAGGARMVVSGLGVPEPEVRDLIRAGDVLYGATVGSPRHVKHHRAVGADFLVAQGSEAAGHVGSISTMVLVPQVVDAAGGLPVLAAGGVGDPRQVRAALALGAVGVWLGSTLLTTTESGLPAVLRRRLLAATSDDARLTRALTGQDERALRSAWTDAWQEDGAPPPLQPPLQAQLVHDTLVRIIDHELEALASVAVGEVVGMMAAEETVADLVERLGAGFDGPERA